MGITWDGLGEAQRELADLPERLIAAVEDLAAQAAQRTASAAQAGYAAESMRGAVRANKLPYRQGPGWRVRNTAPHGHLYESGTVERYRRTGGRTGRMPAARVLIPAAVAARRWMWGEFERVWGRAIRLRWWNATP